MEGKSPSQRMMKVLDKVFSEETDAFIADEQLQPVRIDVRKIIERKNRNGKVGGKIRLDYYAPFNYFVEV